NYTIEISIHQALEQFADTYNCIVDITKLSSAIQLNFTTY
ncbi:25229_t:CDS:1, partial [Gigaspora margarita]